MPKITRTIIILTLALIVLPWSIRAGEATSTHGDEIINDTTFCVTKTLQIYTCHALTAPALRDHVNHWLDSVQVELIDIQFETTTTNVSSDVISVSDTTGTISYAPIKTKPQITYRAWITYRDRKENN